jgi:mRNA-degrading endonuclease RelE of RelBE toxin-antitoxin system
MKVEFLSGFEKELAKSRDKDLAKVVLNCISLFEDANNLSEIPNIKKLKGHSSAWRFRKGKYRIGFFVENEIIVFAAFAPRSTIYKEFP